MDWSNLTRYFSPDISSMNPMKDSLDVVSAARPKKSLGQNFLTDRNITEKIVAGLDITPENTVFEIGPGRGALTELLNTRSRRLYVLEKDRNLILALKQKMPYVQAICGDGLTFVWERLAGLESLKLVGNLPYNVASPMMWEIFSRLSRFERACFMVQKEVAGRLVAQPGTKAYGGLSVWIQTFVTPQILFHVSPGSFHPRPKVDSTVVGFVPKMVVGVHRRALTRTIHELFQKRRKQLGTILKTYWGPALEAWLDLEGLERTVRPEVLTPLQFHGLAEVLEKSWETLAYQNYP